MTRALLSGWASQRDQPERSHENQSSKTVWEDIGSNASLEQEIHQYELITSPSWPCTQPPPWALGPGLLRSSLHSGHLSGPQPCPAHCHLQALPGCLCGLFPHILWDFPIFLTQRGLPWPLYVYLNPPPLPVLFPALFLYSALTPNIWLMHMVYYSTPCRIQAPWGQEILSV